MQKIVTAEEMREIDRLTTERYGIPQLLLMENAAHAASRVIVEKLGGSVDGKSVDGLDISLADGVLTLRLARPDKRRPCVSRKSVSLTRSTSLYSTSHVARAGVGWPNGAMR